MWCHVDLNKLTDVAEDPDASIIRIERKCVISGFRREVAESCALPGHYSASTGKKLLLLSITSCVIAQKSAVLRKEFL